VFRNRNNDLQNITFDYGWIIYSNSAGEVSVVSLVATNSVTSPGMIPLVELFDFEACLRMSAFQFIRGSAIYKETFQFLDEIKGGKVIITNNSKLIYLVK
jgi:hypothetical protein